MAFAFSRSITIDHLKVAGNLTDFPLLFAGTYDYLATSANGGGVENANGYDVGFFSDIDLTTPLDWEVELYTASNGTVVYWVRVPSLSASVDTVIYIGYGDASIVTDQSNKTGVWGSIYKWVCHNPFVGTDSTSGPLNGIMTAVGAIAGKIDGAGDFNGSTSELTVVTPIKLDVGVNLAVEAWVKLDNLSSVNGQRFVYKGTTTFFPNFGLEVNSTGHPVFYANGRDFTPATWGTALTVSTLTHLAGVWDGTNHVLYVNGVQVATSPGGFGYTGADLFLSFPATSRAVDGIIDEVRISGTERSAAWILTNYNSQSSPATFYSIGGDASIPYLVNVDGVERDPLLATFNIMEPVNGIATMRADFDTAGSPIFRPDLDAEIRVLEFGEAIFGGYITAIRERGFDGPNGESVVVETTSADYKIATTRRYVNEVFNPGSPALVLRDVLDTLVTNYLAVYGITLDAGQVDGPVMDPVVYEDRLLKDVLDELSVLTGYVWDINVDKELRMYAIGTETAPFDLDETVLPAPYFGDITVEPTRSQYANRIYLSYGPDGAADVFDYFFADGIQDTFQLSARIVGPNYDSNSVGYGYIETNHDPILGETFGLVGTIGVSWKYDPDTWQIIYTSGPVPAGNLIRVQYIGQFPQVITVEDAGEIALHTLYELKVPATDTMDRTVATSLANAELAKHLIVLRKVTYSTRERGLAAGQTQVCLVPKRDLDTTAVVVEVVTESEPGGDLLVRRVTAIEGAVVHDDWRDIYRQWLG